MPQLREALAADFMPMLEIHNHYVLNTNKLPEREPRSPEEHTALFSGLLSRGFPVLVAAPTEGDVIGYCYVDAFASGRSYAPALRVHIYLKQGYHGQGIGTRLLRTLIERSRGLNRRTMVSVIDSTNLASIKLHEKCGFAVVGALRDVGFKNGVFVSATYMQYWFDGAFSFE